MHKRRGWTVALAFCIAGCGASLTPAESAEEASRSYDRAEFDRAASLYEDACDGGVGSACARLGMMYMLGQGLDQDVQVGTSLYTKACDADDARACALLGDCYLNGRGVGKDEQRAVELFEKSCKANYASGCTEYGVALWRGRGGAANPAKGEGLLKKSCAARHPDGCFYLGVLLRMGDEGVPKDPHRAEQILDRGCKLGQREACAYLDKHRSSLQMEQAGMSAQDEEPDAAEGEATGDAKQKEGASAAADQEKAAK